MPVSAVEGVVYSSREVLQRLSSWLPLLLTYNSAGAHRQSRNNRAVTVCSSRLQTFAEMHSTANEEPTYRPYGGIQRDVEDFKKSTPELLCL